MDGNGNPVPGITLSPTSVTVDGGPVTQALTVSVDSSVSPGAYDLRVRGTSGSLTRQASLSLTVSASGGGGGGGGGATPSFTLSLNPTSLSVQQGGSAQTALTLTPQGGFTGTVSLDLVDGNGNPVPGITLSPTSVTVDGGPVTQALTVSVDSSVSPGAYDLRVRGTSGSLTRQASLSLTVSASGGGGGGGGGATPSFTLSLNPTSLSVQQGAVPRPPSPSLRRGLHRDGEP